MRHVAVIAKNHTNPAYGGALFGVRSVAAKFGYEVRHSAPQKADDIDEQAELIARAIAEKPAAIVLIPAHETKLGGSIRDRAGGNSARHARRRGSRRSMGLPRGFGRCTPHPRRRPESLAAPGGRGAGGHHGWAPGLDHHAQAPPGLSRRAERISRGAAGGIGLGLFPERRRAKPPWDCWPVIPGWMPCWSRTT